MVNRKVPLTICIDKELKEHLQKSSVQNSRSLSGEVAHLLKKITHIEKEEETKHD